MYTYYTYACPNCGHNGEFQLGFNSWAPVVSMKMKEAVSDGCWGDEWCDFVAQNPNGGIDSEFVLYVCECGKWLADRARDYYIPADLNKRIGAYVKNSSREKNKCVKHFRHSCPDCGETMSRVDIDNEKLKCPICRAELRITRLEIE